MRDWRSGLAALLWLGPGAALAQEAAPLPLLPRLEVGIGGLAMGMPDYRGSDYYAARVLPIATVIYRSPFLQVNRDGIRARLFSTERLSLTASAAINLRGNDDNPDRAGMPELDHTLEIGPALDWFLTERRDGFRARLRLPLRGVVAADGLKLRKVGWTLTPHVRTEWIELSRDWSKFHFLSLGPVFSTESYHDYFYEVDAAEATLPERPAYDARGGYSGVRFGVSSSMARQRWRFGLFMSYDYLGGARFDDSPLVKTDHAASGGLFVAYRLYASGSARPLEEEKP